MSQRYLGGVITANPTTPTLSNESGVWTLEQQFQNSATWSPRLIGQSVRLRSSASAYFNRTPASAGNRKTWTWSGWVKRGILQNAWLLGADDGSLYSNAFYSSDYLAFNHVPNTGGTVYQWRTPAVFRDPSAWYHIIFAIDTTQATASNRIRIYVNGTEQTNLVDATGYGAIPQNTDTFINSVQSHMIGRFIRGANNQFDGYLTEVNFIDGQALTPSSFGAFDTNGIWQPLQYTGTYGTNGFYLTFADTTSTTTIGYDTSGNGNNWTANNISLTSGVTYDAMIDSPTNYADGGNGRGNYCVLNPNFRGLGGTNTFSNGNLQNDSNRTAANNWCSGTMALPSSGKWYCEVVATVTSSVGIVSAWSPQVSTGATNPQYFRVYYGNNGQKGTEAGYTSYGATFTNSNTIGIAVDMDAGTITFYKDNTSQGVAFSDLISSGIQWCFGASYSGGSTNTTIWNFGQRPFAYTPPTGFKALNTQNLPDATIKQGNKYFDASLYTGNQTSLNVVNGGAFQPDLVWIKARSTASIHYLQDAVRGALNNLDSSSTGAEQAQGGTVTSFNSNGFSLGASNGPNASGTTYVGWQWKAAGSSVSNTDGSITSTVNANPTAGFSIVTWTGAGGTSTVGHGLGVAPKLFITKSRSTVQDWYTFTNASGSWQYGFLNTTATFSSTTQGANSTTLTGLSGTSTNGSGTTYVAYCFAEVAGYSKFGNYTNNSSTDGPFVYLGFRPRFVLIKYITAGASDWMMFDSSRDTYNVEQNYLRSNLSNAEASKSWIDFLSNGFKVRNTDTTSASINYTSGAGTFIFAAFAENPFNLSRAR
jgi:hypothetical protein